MATVHNARQRTRTVPSMSVDELNALPVTTDVPTAGRALGMSRDKAYEAAREGTFPVPVIRTGLRIVVPTRALRVALGYEDTPTG